MAEYDLVIRGSRIITRAGEVPRCVAVRDGVVVAIEPLEARLEERDTVEDVYEPYLLQLGFIQRTPRGRIVTSSAASTSAPRRLPKKRCSSRTR